MIRVSIGVISVAMVAASLVIFLDHWSRSRQAAFRSACLTGKPPLVVLYEYGKDVCELVED